MPRLDAAPAVPRASPAVATSAQADRNRRTVDRICASLAVHDIAGADTLVAADARIRGAPLFSSPGTPVECTSFAERFATLDRAGMAWKLVVHAIEQLGECTFLVTATIAVTRRPGEHGYAGLTGSVWDVREGTLISLAGFDTAREAQAYARAVVGATAAPPD